MPSLNDLSINFIAYINPKLYFGNAKDNMIYIYENTLVTLSFQAYTTTLLAMEVSSSSKNGFLITFGVDKEIGSCIKIFNNDNSQSLFFLIKLLLLEPLKIISFGKFG